MTPLIQIRPLHESDAAEVAELVTTTMSISNRKEYDDATLANICAYFTPRHIARISKSRSAFVAVDRDRIVGTAGTAPDREFDGAYRVLTFVVHPDYQGRGIGRTLQNTVEQVARSSGAEGLTVASSLTARGFYAACGFREIEERMDERHGAYVMMSKTFSAPETEEMTSR